MNQTRWVGIWAALLLSVVLFVWGPTQIFFSNPTEFLSGFLVALPYLAGFALASWAAFAVMALLLKGRALAWYAGGLAVIAAFLWVSSALINPDYGPLNGQAIDFNSKLWWVVVELAVLATLFFVARQMLRRSPKGLATCLFLFSMVLLVDPVVQMATHQAEPAREAVAPPGQSFAFSTSKNVLVVLLDGFQSDVFAEIVSEHPDIKAAFDGFTYFAGTAGVGATTYLSLPSIHSGKEYSSGEPLKAYFRNSIGKNSFLSGLVATGYDATLVNPLQRVCPKGVHCVGGTSIVGSKDSRNPALDTALQLADLSLFRAAPVALAKIAYNRGQFLMRRYVISPKATHHVVVALDAMNAFARDIVSSNKPHAYFLHMMVPHPPAVLDASCSFAGPLEFTRDTYKTQATCGLQSFVRILTALKEAGLYDSTVVALIADHGTGFPSAAVSKEEAAKSANQYWPGLVGLANPVFVIKPMHSTGELAISDAQVNLPDLGATVCSLTKDCPVSRPSAFSEPDDRVRVFNYYDWKNEYWEQDTIPISPQTIHGPIFQADAWNKPVQ